jgi:superfamily II DNA or RNA helicase
MFVRSLTSSVLPHVRAKGPSYHQQGSVVAVTGSDVAVHAIVRGGRNYQVEIAREPGAFRASCDCPFFIDRQEICKHIWAALLEAEERGMLDGDGGPPATLEPDLTRVPRRHVRATLTTPVPRPQPEWQRFLGDLRHRLDQQEQTERQRPYADGQLLYVVDVNQTLAGRGLVLLVQWRQRKKNGGWTRPKPAVLSPALVDSLPDADDREIHGILLGAGDPPAAAPGYYHTAMTGRAHYVLVSAVTTALLPRLARTGRLYLSSPSGQVEAEPVVWDDGPAWRAELKVTQPEGTEIRVEASLVRGDERMPIEHPVLILDAGFLFTHDSLARFESGGTFGWLAELRRRHTVTFPPVAADAVAEALARSGVDPGQLPPALRYESYSGTPRPAVLITRQDTPYSFIRREQLQAALQFDYDGTSVPAGSGPLAYDAARRRLIRRDLEAEQRAYSRLRQLGFQAADGGRGAHGLSIVIDRFPAAVRALAAEGWRVEAEGRLFRAPRDMDVRISSGVDWFELHGQVDFGDGQGASLRDLLAALKRGERTIALDDGTRGVLPEDWLQRYAGIAAFGELEDDHVRFKPTQTALLDALLAAQPAIAVDDTFERARAALQTFEGVRPEEPPPGFTGILRGYQKEALGWFAFLRRFNFGGCLADDMGLGKTVMVTALLAGRDAEAQGGERRPSLVVLPRSLVFNWLEETRRFAPGLRVLDYTGSGRELSDPGAHDVVLATYGTLKRDVAHLKDVAFDYVILDEAQAVKNPATAGAKAVRLLRGRHRLALSGTPIENHLGELWSLFEFLNPGFLGTAAGFKAATAGRLKGEPMDLAVLARAIRPFVLRRTKAEVAPELPERSEQTIHCELDAPQRRFYDQLRTRFRQSLLARISRSGVNRSRIQILEALLRLRQAACHPGLIEPSRRGEPSAKLDVLSERLAEVASEGHKALVFSQFTSFLALVRERLERDGLLYAYLDGETRDRETPVQHFQTDPACRVFLISLKAGGLGLNLTAAEYVFLLDPWWNPAVEAQAIDRAHRIGQTRHVFAYRLIARDTVEEKVAELQQSKRELADAILSSDTGPISNLKAEDVAWLLS